MCDDWGKLEGVSQGRAGCALFSHYSVCLEVYILRIREVLYCLKIAFSLVKKEYVLFFLECKEVNLLCEWVRGFNLTALCHPDRSRTVDVVGFVLEGHYLL